MFRKKRPEWQTYVPYEKGAEYAKQTQKPTRRIWGGLLIISAVCGTLHECSDTALSPDMRQFISNVFGDGYDGLLQGVSRGDIVLRLSNYPSPGQSQDLLTAGAAQLGPWLKQQERMNNNITAEAWSSDKKGYCTVIFEIPALSLFYNEVKSLGKQSSKNPAGAAQAFCERKNKYYQRISSKIDQDHQGSYLAQFQRQPVTMTPSTHVMTDAFELAALKQREPGRG